MKIVQLNAWVVRIGRPVVELLTKEDADIVCLQEIVSQAANMPSIIGTPLEDLQKQLGYNHVFFSPVFNFRIMNTIGKFGNCIFSKKPFDKKEVIFTNLELVEDFNFDDYDYNIRNLQHVVIKHKNKSLNILNHHGHHLPEHKNGDAETFRQMKVIADYIDKLNGPIILAGDFNLAPHSESIEQINKRLINLPVKHRLKTTRTPFTHKREVCDYIFISKDVKVNNFQALEEAVSDHKALVLDFDL